VAFDAKKSLRGKISDPNLGAILLLPKGDLFEGVGFLGERF